MWNTEYQMLLLQGPSAPCKKKFKKNNFEKFIYSSYIHKMSLSVI